MKRWGRLLVIVGVIMVSCCDPAPPPSSTEESTSAAPIAPPAETESTARLLFVGDIMPARDVAPVVAAEGVEVFAEVRATLGRADAAFGNLEAALAADVGGSGLVAPSESAAVLAAAGFDVLSVANNHSADAGSSAVTAQHLNDAGLEHVGLAAADVSTMTVAGLAVATLAVDLTAAAPSEVVAWNRDEMTAAVSVARETADIVTVSVHGGVEMSPRPDPALEAAVAALAMAGADIVWAHGSHVAYPVEVIDPDADGRPSVVAYGLGNFLFDQRISLTTSGLMLEVLADSAGVTALRVGVASHDDLRVHFDGWLPPAGDATSLAGQWWSLAQPPAELRPSQTVDVALDDSEVAAAALGQITGDPDGEVVVAFRRPFRPTAVNQRFDEAAWTDAAGRSAHLGLYEPTTMEQVWVAGSIARPIDALAACDGSIAVSYAAFDDSSLAASAGWHWSGFGFEVTEQLHGEATPACADIDGDGLTDPVLLRGGVIGLYEPG